MSLDYILIHGNLEASSIGDLVEDCSLKLEAYQALAQQIFPSAEGESETLVAGRGSRPPCSIRRGHATCPDVSVSLTAFDGSLHLSCRGGGDIFHLALRVAQEARNLGFVTVDVQTSAIIDPESAASSPEYIDWYRRVASSSGG